MRSSRRVNPVKTSEEVEALRRAAAIVSGVHSELAPLVVPGATTAEFDRIAEEYIRDHGAEPAFKGYIMSDETSPYPATLCTSVNDVVVHGFPSNEPLRAVDVVSTILPGFIATDINVGRRGPFTVPLEKGVSALVDVIEREPVRGYVPEWPWRTIGTLMKILPLRAIRRVT